MLKETTIESRPRFRAALLTGAVERHPGKAEEPFAASLKMLNGLPGAPESRVLVEESTPPLKKSHE